MYSFVALVSMLGVASASICCIPPQWEGQVGFIVGISRSSGSPVFASGGASMAYDGVNRIIAQRETVTRSTDGQSVSVDVLMDYDRDTKYIRMGSSCIKTKLNRVWYDGCIPDNATLMSQDSQFGFGLNKMAINSYRINMGGILVSYSVTAAGCIPVLETVRGTLDGNDFMQNKGYVNITAGISDPVELAVPPVGCENAPMVQAHYTDGMFNSGMVGRRSLFGF